MCLGVSWQISPGQGLTLASSNRLLKTAPQYDERGKWIFQLKRKKKHLCLRPSRCSKRLIKWDAIDMVLCCSWISTWHVHGWHLAWKNSNTQCGKHILTNTFSLEPFVLFFFAELKLKTIFLKQFYHPRIVAGKCKTPAYSYLLWANSIINSIKLKAVNSRLRAASGFIQKPKTCPFLSC